MADKNGYRRQVMIPSPIWDKVQILAANDTTSASSIVRTALKEYIDRRRKALQRDRKPLP